MKTLEKNDNNSFVRMHRELVLFLVCPLIISAITTAFSSCSVKRDNAAKNKEIITGTGNLKPADEVIYPDKDKDGISDDLENRLGRDITVGTFPTFKISKLRVTEITLKDLSTNTGIDKIVYKTEDNVNFNISYNPIRDKIAKNAYNRVISNFESVSPIDPLDLGVLKISSFSNPQRDKANKFKIQYANDDTYQKVTLKSIFNMDIREVEGIAKIYDIRAMVGFIDKKGEFNSFGSSFNLNSVTGSRIVYTIDEGTNLAVSNQEILIYIDRININDFEDIFSNEYDLAVRIIDYKAETRDGHSFKYNKQVKKSQKVSTLYAISTDTKNQLYFNTKRKSINQFLSKELGEVKTNENGDLLGVDGLLTNTDFPITFEDGGNTGLSQWAWHLFSEKNLVTDTPSTGGTILIGYFQNKELAQAAQRTITDLSYKVFDNTEVICGDSKLCATDLVTGNTLNPKKERLYIPNLNIGERIKISFSGTNYIPVVGRRYAVDTTVEEHWMLCDCIPGGGMRDPRECSGGIPKSCDRSTRSYACTYAKSEIAYISKKIEIRGKNKGKGDDSLVFAAVNRRSSISYEDRSFFNLYKPFYNHLTKKWEIEVLITPEFISKFGEDISLKFPAGSIGRVPYNVVGWEKGECVNERFRYRLGLDSKYPTLYHSGDISRNYIIEVKRNFK